MGRLSDLFLRQPEVEECHSDDPETKCGFITRLVDASMLVSSGLRRSHLSIDASMLVSSGLRRSHLCVDLRKLRIRRDFYRSQPAAKRLLLRSEGPTPWSHL